MQTAHEQLREQVRRVAEARRRLAESEAAFAEREQAFTDANAELLAQMKVDTDLVGQAEGTLRALTLAHYEQTKEKKPVEGVQVKEITTLSYSETEALAWAREKRLALKPESLDVKAFEKIVAALVEKPRFVLEVVTPRADITRDLSAVLVVEVAP